MRQIARQLRASPCSAPNPTLFRRGIATQLIPACESYCDVGQVATPGWRVNSQRTLDTKDWIKGWVLNQLSSRSAIDCADTSLGIKTGGWWADAFRGDVGFISGSKLWSLQWSKTINETLQIAQRYAEDALGYLTAWKVADSITVDVAYVSRTVLTLTVTIKGPNVDVSTSLTGQQLPDFGWLWQERPVSRNAA